jgi:hypothetical protein
MARAIDGGTLRDNLTDIYGDGNRLVYLNDVLDLIDEQPTLTPPNEALTLEQLREMDGQPVWDSSLRCWGIVKSEKDGDVFLQTKSGEFGLDPLGRVKIYRRPPEGEA